MGFSIPTARRLLSNVVHSRSRDFRESFFFVENLYEYVHSVIIEPAKVILVGTGIIYEATGDAGIVHCMSIILYLVLVHRILSISTSTHGKQHQQTLLLL